MSTATSTDFQTGIPEFQSMVDFFTEKHSGTGVGYYSADDWNRLLVAYRVTDGNSVLDIGVGNGALLNVFANTDRFERICGVDIARHSKLELPNRVEYELMSVTNLRYDDDEFDTVVCTEVLQNLEIKDFPAGLAEIRRVARNRLIVTLPLNEPEPVWWHDKPGGHRQSFSMERLRELFPTAVACEVSRNGGTPWLMIVEDQRCIQYGLKIATSGRVIEFLKGWPVGH